MAIGVLVNRSTYSYVDKKVNGEMKTPHTTLTGRGCSQDNVEEEEEWEALNSNPGHSVCWSGSRSCINGESSACHFKSARH